MRGSTRLTSPRRSRPRAWLRIKLLRKCARYCVLLAIRARSAFQVSISSAALSHRVGGSGCGRVQAKPARAAASAPLEAIRQTSTPLPPAEPHSSNMRLRFHLGPYRVLKSYDAKGVFAHRPAGQPSPCRLVPAPCHRNSRRLPHSSGKRSEPSIHLCAAGSRSGSSSHSAFHLRILERLHDGFIIEHIQQRAQHAGPRCRVRLPRPSQLAFPGP